MKEPDQAAVEKALRSMGWQSEQPKTEEPLEEEEDALEALNFNEHEIGEKIDIPEGVVADLAPPPKERVRRLAGGAEDTPTKTEEPEPDPWSRKIPQLGTVSVTPEELEIYTRSLLHDTRFELPVDLWMGANPIRVHVRSLYMAERELLALTTAQVVEAYPIKSVSNAAIVSDVMMKLHVLVQLTQFGEQKLEAFNALPENGRAEDSPKIQELALLVRTRFAKTHQAKMMAMIRALHIFETKQQILEDCFHNRDFPRPAGAY